MPIATTDLVEYLSANHPQDDISLAGGAIALTGRPDVTQLTATSVVAAVSDGADTRTLTVTGRLASGVVDTDALVLTGVTEVVGAKSFERILSLVLSATDGARTVTVRQGAGGATRATIAPTETTRRILFAGAASEAAPTVWYEKTFYRNNHGTLALTSAETKLTADPSAKLEVGIAATKDDTATIANRKTVPAGITFVDDNIAQSVPTGSLGATESIGIWRKLSLLADDAPLKTTSTVQLAGTTA